MQIKVLSQQKVLFSLQSHLMAKMVSSDTFLTSHFQRINNRQRNNTKKLQVKVKVILTAL